MYEATVSLPKELPPVTILNSLRPVWDVGNEVSNKLPAKRYKGLPPLPINSAEPRTPKSDNDGQQQTRKICHSPTFDRVKCLLRPNRSAPRIITPHRSDPSLTDYVLDIGPLPAPYPTASLPSISSSGTNAQRPTKKRPPHLNLQHSTCGSNHSTPRSTLPKLVIPDSGGPFYPRNSTPPLDETMASKASKIRRHSVLQRSREPGITPDQVSSNQSEAADSVPSPNILEEPWEEKRWGGCHRRSSFADFPIWSAPQSRANKYEDDGEGASKSTSVRRKRRSSDPNVPSVDIYDWENFLPVPVQLSPIILEFPGTTLTTPSDACSSQSSVICKEGGSNESKKDKSLPQTPLYSVRSSSPSDLCHNAHVSKAGDLELELELALDIALDIDVSLLYDRDEPGISRKDLRHGWSGEWNQPHIQDVIERLRALK